MSQLSPQSNLDVLLLTNPAANRGRAQATGDEVHSYLTRAGHRVQHQVPEDISITRHMVDEAVSTQKRIIAVGADGAKVAEEVVDDLEQEQETNVHEPNAKMPPVMPS